MSWRAFNGDCVDVMKDFDDSSFDAVVTDPPYGLEFMGKDWDKLAGTPGYNERGRVTERVASDSVPSAFIGAGGRGVNSYQAGLPMQEWHEKWAKEALRVLKPGGYLLAFGGARTYHRLASGVEDAGFEIRDQIMWLYATGFPKSKDLGEGRGTALKPAHEPIVVARKPFAGTTTANVAEWGTGGLNIKSSLTPYASEADLADALAKNPGREDTVTSAVYGADRPQQRVDKAGRWPANLVVDEGAGLLLDEQSGPRKSGGYPERRGSNAVYDSPTSGGNDGPRRLGDAGGAARFFFCAKAGTLERSFGIDDEDNPHPTVKPIELMRWLIGLVTPPGGILLDPFLGSGTTGCAAVLDSYDFVGIEKDVKEGFFEAAKQRIAKWAEFEGQAKVENVLRTAAAERMAKTAGQVGLFD